ncbi:MAG TPA: hypothetical protein VIH61_10545, partial [Waddliaceae bacterium]
MALALQSNIDFYSGQKAAAAGMKNAARYLISQGVQIPIILDDTYKSGTFGHYPQPLGQYIGDLPRKELLLKFTTFQSSYLAIRCTIIKKWVFVSRVVDPRYGDGLIYIYQNELHNWVIDNTEGIASIVALCNFERLKQLLIAGESVIPTVGTVKLWRPEKPTETVT